MLQFQMDTVDWQKRYMDQDTPWDKGSAAPPLIDYLARHCITGRVLLPGCGRGHDAREIASRGNCEVLGLDLSPRAIELARTSLPVYPHLAFEVGDFFSLPTEWQASFDWIVEHTCYCAIDPASRQDYVRSAAQLLKPGGKIFGLFFLTPDLEPGEGPPFPSTTHELEEFFGSTFSVLEQWVPTHSYPGREGRELVRILERRGNP